jgi:hypothetical protein
MSLEKQLKLVDRKNNILLFCLLAMSFVVIFLTEYFSLSKQLSNAICIIFLGGSLVLVLYKIVIGKKRIAIENGLLCNICKKIPKAFFIKSAYLSKKCIYCGADYVLTK